MLVVFGRSRLLFLQFRYKKHQARSLIYQLFLLLFVPYLIAFVLPITRKFIRIDIVDDRASETKQQMLLYSKPNELIFDFLHRSLVTEDAVQFVYLDSNVFLQRVYLITLDS